ncbi:MAG: hypothetical protein WBV94_25070 [Blastocatellia bacterium]
MILKKEHDEIYLIELDEQCATPFTAHKGLLDAEVEYSNPSYFRWRRTFRHEDAQDINIEFGQGILSPAQNTVLLLHRASKATGSYVKFPSEYYYCPVLCGYNDDTVPLFEFVEVLDSVVDYDKIKEEFPSLSYAQIHGSMMFLRKVMQFNILDKDIDEEFGDESEFIDEIRQALADWENTRVLNFNKQDNR